MIRHHEIARMLERVKQSRKMVTNFTRALNEYEGIVDSVKITEWPEGRLKQST